MSDAPPPLEVHADRQGTVVTATLRGELDLATADVARTALRTAIGDGAERLELDLSGVSFVDSSGLAVFIELASCITVAVEQASPAVQRTVEMTGLHDVLGLAP